MINYEGIFFEDREVEKLFQNEGTFLGIRNDIPHITFLYKPDKEHLLENVIGEEVACYLTGYGCDGENSAFMVSFPDRYTEYYQNKDQDGKTVIPHVTVSLSLNGKAVHSKDLTFVKFKEPVLVTGRFGYWIHDNDKEYVQFEKILPKLKEQS